MPDSHRDTLRGEFARVAGHFTARTTGRFAELGVVEFARAAAGETVVEVGVGTGSFLPLFEGEGRTLLGIDVTIEMLAEAARDHPGTALVQADGARLPLKGLCVDLVTSAQVLHHIPRPLIVLQEMRRVAKEEGRVLIVDQAATERVEEVELMHRLEVIRDPSHAGTRPPSAFRILIRRAGLEVVDERIVDSEQRLSKWMWPGEFPHERVERVRNAIEEFGHGTGMNFERDGDDWVFNRRRIMLLARRSKMIEASRGNKKLPDAASHRRS